MKRWIWSVAILLMLTVFGIAGYLGYRTSQRAAAEVIELPPTIAVDRGDVVQSVSAPGQLAGMREHMLGFGIAGTISEIDVRAGDYVSAGDVLARLDDNVLNYAIEIALANLAIAEAKLDKLELTAPPNPQDIAMARADVEKARVELRRAEDESLNQSKLIAPFDGVILDVRAKAGETLNAGAPLMHLLDPQALEAYTTVTEEDYPLIQTGQAAQLYFDSQPDLMITGTVTAIAPLRTSDSDSPVYPVYIELDSTPDGLAPGMTVDSSILIDQRSDVLRLPRALARVRGDGSAQIAVWANGTTEARTIQTGLRGDQYVEILSGVAEGEQVVSR